MKKIMSTLIASAMAVSAITLVSASALNEAEKDVLSVSTETLTSSITVDDVSIPAGTVAVTVNISNNSGFSSSSTNIVVGDAYTPITDESGRLVVENGSVIGNSLVCGTTNDELIFVATASARDNIYDGEMFTFYVSNNELSNADTIEIVKSESEDISTTIRNTAVNRSAAGGYFKVGDVDNNGYVNASDASFILSAVATNKHVKLPVTDANENLSYYFPNATNIVCAQAANPICSIDNNGNVSDSDLYDALLEGSINSTDADDILVYQGLAATGQLADYANQSDGFCGRILYCN